MNKLLHSSVGKFHWYFLWGERKKYFNSISNSWVGALSNCGPTHARPHQPTPGHSNQLQATLIHSKPFWLTAGQSIYSRLLSKHNHTLFETILGSQRHSRKFSNFIYFFFNPNDCINQLNHYLESIFNFGVRKFHKLLLSQQKSNVYWRKQVFENIL